MGKTMGKILCKDRSPCDMVWCGTVSRIISVEQYAAEFPRRNDSIYTFLDGGVQQKPNPWHDETNEKSDIGGRNVLLMKDVSRFSTASVSGRKLLDGLELARATQTIQMTDELRTEMSDIQSRRDDDISRYYGSTDAKRAASVKRWGT